jgi:hypothetical protein
MSSAGADFVDLLHQQGLDHLTQKIVLMLISVRDEECSLSEAKLVSRMWREAVDALVLNTAVGKTTYLRRIKRVIRR